MKRKLLIILLAITAVVAGAFGLAACGGNDEGDHEHEYGSWVITLDPTCTESGEQRRTCECGAYQEEELLPLGHLMNEHHDAQDASCSEAGWNAYDVCTRGCGYSTKVELPTIPHTYVNYKCDICQSDMYDVSESGVITKFNDSNLTEITVPSTLGGKPVTGIGSHALADSGITSVTIEEGITVIDGAAFESCVNLTTVKIPNSVTSIDGAFLGCDKIEYNFDEQTNSYYLGNDSNRYLVYIKPAQTSITEISINAAAKIIYSGAFSGCTNLETVALPADVTFGSDLFEGCANLKSITFPENVTEISDSMFSGCAGLETFTIPDGVTTIRSGAFSDCTSLTEITIPYGVTVIGSGAFSGCTSLTEITIPASVTNISGSAFESSGITSIVFYGTGLTSIDNTAFGGCESLKSVVLPDGLIQIGSYLFQDCANLEWVYVPHSVSVIGGEIFMATGRNVILYYEGTESDWNAIQKTPPYYNVTVYLYSELPPEDNNGNYWHWDGDLPVAWSK